MRKLSKRVRQQKAVAEAEAHVRKFGLHNVDDWAYSIAAHWGFVDDDNIIIWLIAFMRSVPDKMEVEKVIRDQKNKDERKAYHARQQREVDEAYKQWKERRDRDGLALPVWKGPMPLSDLGSKDEQTFLYRLYLESTKRNSD
jgi:hypothetical protein